MKIQFIVSRSQGNALMVLLVLIAVSMLVLGSAMRWTFSTSRINDRFQSLQRAQFAAEAATEKVLSSLTLDYKNSGESVVFNSLSTYRSGVPTSTESALWSQFQFNNAANTLNQTFVSRIRTVEFVPLESQYRGLSGYASTYRVVSNARETVGMHSNLLAAVQQDVQLASIPIFQFAMFHSGILDITGSATLTVRGRVHSNGSIYAGSSANQTFFDDVTAVGIIGKVPYAGYSLTDYQNGTLTFHDQYDTNVAALSLPVGTNNSAAAVHAILDPPAAGESILSAMGQQRYFNKAELLVLVKSTGVVAGVKQTFSTTTNFFAWNQVSNFISTNKTFTDLRENKTIRVTEFNVGAFNSWAITNANVRTALGGTNRVPSIVYISDDRTWTTTNLAGVRVINAHTLATNGLTIATPEPLYTLGNFNAASSHIGTTNTSLARPASLIADALTILSTNWASGNYDGSPSRNSSVDTRPAASTTINAAILTGEVYGGANGVNPYSAGIMNLPRLLEDWNGDTLTVNGSLVCLYNSTNAVGAFRMPGDYYRAPTRNFSFDNNFRDPAKLPPGTPELRALVRGKWLLPPAGTTNFTFNN